MKALVALMEGREAGMLTQGVGGRLEFAYAADWTDPNRSTPLSLSMPVTGGPYGDAVTRPFLEGLLPDNDEVLKRWGRTFEVSPRNPFALLEHVGEDCAGAVQFVVPDRVAELLEGHGSIDWLTDDQVAERLQALRVDPTAWHATETGQFSLAGAQAKTALFHDAVTDRWGVPHGAIPTTHILKPAIKGFDDHDLNEHLCLDVARRLGIPAVHSRVAPFGEERAIVVERYDRRSVDGKSIARVHQEDVCQALGIPPTRKYQSDGGPSPERIMRMLGDVVRSAWAAENAMATFVDALALNWLLGGTDAHAKNYSLLVAGPQVRLAPLYDVASALPYDGMPVQKLTMAMKVGGQHRLMRVESRHWRRLADAVGFHSDAVVERVNDLASRLPDELAAAASAPDVEVVGTDLPRRMVDAVAAWTSHCRAVLD